MFFIMRVCFRENLNNTKSVDNFGDYQLAIEIQKMMHIVWFRRTWSLNQKILIGSSGLNIGVECTVCTCTYEYFCEIRL